MKIVEFLKKEKFYVLGAEAYVTANNQTFVGDLREPYISIHALGEWALSRYGDTITESDLLLAEIATSCLGLREVRKRLKEAKK